MPTRKKNDDFEIAGLSITKKNIVYFLIACGILLIGVKSGLIPFEGWFLEGEPFIVKSVYSQSSVTPGMTLPVDVWVSGGNGSGASRYVEVCVFPWEWPRGYMGYTAVSTSPFYVVTANSGCCSANAFCKTQLVSNPDSSDLQLAFYPTVPSAGTYDACNGVSPSVTQPTCTTNAACVFGDGIPRVCKFGLCQLDAYSPSGRYNVVAGTYVCCGSDNTCTNKGYKSIQVQSVSVRTTTTTTLVSQTCNQLCLAQSYVGGYCGASCDQKDLGKVGECTGKCCCFTTTTTSSTIPGTCTANHHTGCYNGHVYNFNSCNEPGSRVLPLCQCGCTGDYNSGACTAGCVTNPTSPTTQPTTPTTTTTTPTCNGDHMCVAPENGGNCVDCRCDNDYRCEAGSNEDYLNCQDCRTPTTVPTTLPQACNNNNFCDYGEDMFKCPGECVSPATWVVGAIVVVGGASMLFIRRKTPPAAGGGNAGV